MDVGYYILGLGKLTAAIGRGKGKAWQPQSGVGASRASPGRAGLGGRGEGGVREGSTLHGMGLRTHRSQIQERDDIPEFPST